MKRTLTSLVLCVMVAMGALAQPTAVIKKASVNPVIDGEIDYVWAESAGENYIDQSLLGQVPTLGISFWQGLWTDEGIWILVTVDDDAFFPHYAADPIGTAWMHDKPELYFDVNYILKDGLGPMALDQGHYQVAPAFADGMNDGRLLTCGFNAEAGDIIQYAFNVADPSYIAEYFVPFEYLTDLEGLPIDLTGEIGFDVYVIDRDPGEDAASEGRNAVWANTGENGSSWNNMDDCGTITFEGAEAPVYIESITLSGETEITENNGTLQLVAEVLPANYNERLEWLVSDGADGGMAKIDKNGLVTALIDGTVTVTCQSVSLSEIATMEVNISNQIISVPEHNLIRNGYFEKVNPDGSIPEWSGGDGENPAYVTEDGYVVLDPSPGGINVGDFGFSQQNFGCNSTDEYTFSFVAWADDIRTFNVDFEAPVDPYIRYGTSSHPYSTGGESDWTFDVTTEPVHYVLDVVFDRLTEGMPESLNFMFGTSGTVVYLDSVVLINNKILDLVTEYTPVTYIGVEGADGANSVPVGNTLQMSAEVLPADALITDVRWSVEPGTGTATIDKDGLLSGVTHGTVTVVASAKDDSYITGERLITVTWPLGVPEQSVNTLGIYPNPAVSELNVVLTRENSTVSIYNSLGMKMDEVLVSGTEHRFDISAYAAGIYFVRTEGAVSRFVK
ncbi:MAG: Ig-like domain-containing protein [Bacteroidota bacterium]